MPGILYVVATPIGNLEDVTLRALRILREVSVIAAEDTRRTAKLLQQYSISTPTTSLHEHNERQRAAQLLGRLQAGESVALVSDAGTPLISDPGLRMVRLARDSGIKVEPIPGPSAAVAALSAAGIDADSFTFLGFPPAKAGPRRRWLEAVGAEPRPVVLYEAPHRLRSLLGDMAELWPSRRLVVARELTKLHEELVAGPISELLEYFAAPRGEFTLILESEPELPARDGSALPPIEEEFAKLMSAGGLSRREAVKVIARNRGLKGRDVYAAVLAQEPDSGQETES